MPDPASPLRVLVVEDDACNADMVRLSLTHAGYEVGVAGSGDEALRLAGGAWDAVVLDLHLPGVDGLEVARRLRADPRTARVPLVAVTALSSDEDRAAADAAGIDTYVIKPYRRQELIAVLQAAIGGRRPEH